MSSHLSMSISLPLATCLQSPTQAGGRPAFTPELQQAVLKLVAAIFKQIMGQLSGAGAGGGAGGGAQAPMGDGQPLAGGAPGEMPSSAPAGFLGLPFAAPAGPAGPAASTGAATAPAYNDGPKPTGNASPPAGKTAQDIIGDNKTLAQLDPKARDMLKKQFPNYETDPKQAFNASQAIDWIKSSRTADGKPRSDSVTKDGKIEGFTKDHDARHGTEAGLLKDFSEKGYAALKDDHRLDHTSDRHVRTDGTNRSNDSVNLERAGEVLAFIPGLGNVLKGMGRADRDHEASAGEMIAGGLAGVVRTWKNDFEGAVEGLKKGRINPLAMAGEMYKANLEDGVRDNLAPK